MRIVGSILLIAALLSASSAFDRKFAAERLAEQRIRAQNVHIDHLEEELEKLEAEFQQLSNSLTEKEIQTAKGRLFRNEVVRSKINESIIGEGIRCTEKEAICGPQSDECVSNLFFCDGRKDCRNGYDEDPHVCSTFPVEEGASYSAWIYWSSAWVSWGTYMNYPPTHHYITSITSAYRSPFFPARVRFTFSETSVHHPESPNPTVFNAEFGYGYYIFASQQLLFYGSQAGPFGDLAWTCNFHHGTHDYATCIVYKASSGYVIASSTLERQ